MIFFTYPNVRKLMKKTQKFYRYASLTFVSVLLSTLILSGIKPEIAYAANSYSDASLVEKARVWVMGRAVSECINNVGFETNNKRESDINDKGQWMWSKTGFDGSTNIGEWAADNTEDKSDDSRANCATAAKKTLELMGISGVDALCKMNDLADKEIWKRENGGGDCLSGATDLDFDEDNNDKRDTQIWNRFFADWMGVSKVEDALTNGMRFLIYRENFYQECSQDHGENWGTPREWKASDNESDKVYKLKWNLNRTAGDPGGADKDWYVVSGGNGKDHTVHIDGYGMLFNDDTATCKQLAERINDHADNYLEELGKSTDEGLETGAGSGTAEGESCWSNSGPLAWLLCSVLDVIDGAISLIDTWVNNLLFIDADQYNSNGVRDGNAIMRNIALLLLVPVMMFMVIGTALNFGPFDPYTVKKALPRMFVATIFIVLSLPITQFGVEVSNIVGQGAGNLLLSAGGVPSNYSLGTILGESGSNDTFGGLLLAGGIAASSIVSIGVLLSFASVALVALLIAFVILVMRQVLLTLLIVIAPLAIIVWIFPGNDKLWGVWKGTFIAMLMMYPLISLLVASGKFVANLIG